MISDYETHATEFVNSHRFTKNSDKDLSFKTTL